MSEGHGNLFPERDDRQLAYTAEGENAYVVPMLPQAAVNGAWQIVEMLRSPAIQRYVLQNISKADASIQVVSTPTKEEYDVLRIELQGLKERERCWQLQKVDYELEIRMLKREIEHMRTRSESVRTVFTEKTRADSPTHADLKALSPLPHSSIPLMDDVDKEFMRLNDEPLAMDFSLQFPSFDDPSSSGLVDPIPQASPRATPFVFTNAAGGVLHVEDLAVPERAGSHITYREVEYSSSDSEPHSSSSPRSSPCPKPEDHANMLAPRSSAAAEPMDVDDDIDEAQLSSGRSSPRDVFGIPLPRHVFQFEIRVVRDAAPSVPALTREEQKTCFEDPDRNWPRSDSDDSDDDMTL